MPHICLHRKISWHIIDSWKQVIFVIMRWQNVFFCIGLIHYCIGSTHYCIGWNHYCIPSKQLCLVLTQICIHCSTYMSSFDSYCITFSRQIHAAARVSSYSNSFSSQSVVGFWTVQSCFVSRKIYCFEVWKYVFVQFLHIYISYIY